MGSAIGNVPQKKQRYTNIKGMVNYVTQQKETKTALWITLAQ
jgi:hypothetical protein